MFRALPSILIFLLILLSPVLAQTQDLVINADDLSYNQTENQVTAKGNVNLVYKDVELTGEELLYDKVDEIVHAKEGFVLDFEGIKIFGQNLDYNIKNKVGQATEVKLSYNGIELSGQKASFTQKKFILKNAVFSTCNFSQPHYKVTASEIIFYPKFGWVVAFWGYFWLDHYPVAPVPTYIYDLNAATSKTNNILPFPEIGSNDEDGVFINQRLAWYHKREFSGTYSLSYMSKKGFGGGAEANYIIDKANKGNLRLYTNAGDGYWGGLTHSWLFGEKIVNNDGNPFLFYDLTSSYQFELRSTFSYRERINYERVSLLPYIELFYINGKLWRREATFDSSIFLGTVNEESSQNLVKGGGDLTLAWDFPEQEIGDITPSMNFDSRFYSNGTRWLKASGRLDLKKSLSENISFGLGYLHYFKISGQSPFNYEMYRFNPADRLTSDLMVMFGDLGLGFATSYFLDNWQPEDFDYSISYRFHCYTLLLKYRSMRQEFQFGFSLK